MLVCRLLYSFDISGCDLISDFAAHDRSLCSVGDSIRSIADKERLDVREPALATALFLEGIPCCFDESLRPVSGTHVEVSFLKGRFKGTADG
jgi:hypothetical protein